MTISLDEARRQIWADLTPVGIETIDISQSLGRVLAHDLIALRTQPPFAVAAMDGFAVRSQDIGAGSSRLRLVGEVAAGGRYEPQLRQFEAVRILTGGRLPPDADAVIAQEDANVSAGDVVIGERPRNFRAFRHVRREGVDFLQGDVVLHGGRRLSARDLGLAAAMNWPRIPVRRQPKVAVISTGSELVPAGEMPGANQIIDSCGPLIRASIAAAGGVPIHIGIARDCPEQIRSLAEHVRDIDLLVTIGGISTGSYDVVLDALGMLNLTIGFSQVAIRPGKPVTWGSIGDTAFLGLPGNPVSASICALLFLYPALDRLQGIDSLNLELETVPAHDEFPPQGPHHGFLHGILGRDEAGHFGVSMSRIQDTSVLSGFSRANCLIVREPGAIAVSVGEPVAVIRLERNHRAI